jgi:hypothetical protein
MSQAVLTSAFIDSGDLAGSDDVTLSGSFDVTLGAAGREVRDGVEREETEDVVVLLAAGRAGRRIAILSGAVLPLLRALG